MSIGSGIFDFLSAELSVGTNVFPLTLPQGTTLPAVIYQVVSEIPLNSHSKAQDNPTYLINPLEQTRIQFSVYADTYDDAEAVVSELKVAISGYRGMWDDIDVQSVLPDIELDDYEPETQLWRRIVDVMVWFRPAVGGS